MSLHISSTPVRSRLRLPSTWRVALLLTLSVMLSGCVHRRMLVNSSPPGATVFVDGERVGVTPAGLDFQYYGTREIKLVKDGYESLTVMQRVPAPWYQWFPIEFISDNFLPFKVKNRHEFVYPLVPQERIPNTEELKSRARQLRGEARMGL